MKKVLLSLVSILTVMLGYSQTTINFAAQYPDVTGSSSTQLTTITVDPVTLTFAKGGGSSDPMYYANGASSRMYASNTMTVSVEGKTISSISFTSTTSATNQNLTNFSTTTGNYTISDQGLGATWTAPTGGVSSVVFTVSSGQCRFTEMTVNYTDGSTGGEVTPPVDPDPETPDKPDPSDIKTATIVWANAGYENETSVGTYDGVSPITVICDKGTNASNDPKYYNGGAAVRMYNGNTMTIKLAEGYLLESIVFTTVSGYPFNANNTKVSGGSFEVGNPATTTTWTTTEEDAALTITHNNNTQLRIVSMTINYYAESSDVKFPAGLSYSQSNCVVIYNDEGDYTDLLPVLSYDTNADIKYTSSNTAVATVDDEGGVIIVGTGTTTITADAPENDEYLADTASYELTVLEPITAGYNMDIIWNEVSGDLVMDGDSSNITSYTDESGTIEFAFSKGEGSNAPYYMANTGTINLYTGNTMIVTINNNDAELLGMEFINATSYNFNGTTADRGSMTIAPEYARWEPTVATARAASEGSNTVTFTFAGNTRILMTSVYYDIETGVNTIEAADDAEAVYFNLQGVKVQNPEHGIYVKVVNGKATKVVL